MRPSDLAKLTWVSDPQLSPDRRHVAYVVHRVDGPANKYRSQVWVAAVDGSASPRQLTSGEHNDAQPRWHPEGSALAFTSSRAKDEQGTIRSTLHLLPFGVPGETVTLASGDEAFSGLTFSPDGSMLAVVQRVRTSHYDDDRVAGRPPRQVTSRFTTLNGEGFIVDRPRHVHLIMTDGSAPMHDITPGPWECSSPSWFSDCARLAVAVNRFPNDFTFDIGICSLAPTSDDIADDLTLLTDASGWFESPVVAPSDHQVLVVGAEETSVPPLNAHLGLLSADGTAPQQPDWRTRAVDRSWDPTVGRSLPAFTSRGTVIASHEDRGNTHLVEVSLESGEVQVLVGGEMTVTGWSCDDDSETVVFSAATAGHPSELFVLVDGESQRLTHHTRAFVAAVEPRHPEHFLVTSGDVEVDAWIITPHDFDPAATYPMLLNIHGGPFTQYGTSFFDEFQMQARAGYVVVYSNPRGGSGRSEAWGQAIIGPKHAEAPGSGWGGLDFDDLMAVTDAALDRFDFIDPSRVGVLGGSYGGYMTSWIVTHSDRFAAACSERAVNNLLSLEYSSDIAGFFVKQFGPTFVEDPDEYLRMSPISYVDQLATPLLIIHSDNDLRCPQDQAWQMFNACLMLDKPDVEFWLFPDETHELSRSGSPTHRRQRQELILEFFERRLGAPTAELRAEPGRLPTC